MGRQHTYQVKITWTGSNGVGTQTYRSYARDHVIEAAGKPPIAGSSDPTFHGDRARWNPEELLLGALSACHKLAYLHFCAVFGIVVSDYVDNAEGHMEEDGKDGGRFTKVILRPRITIRVGDDLALAERLHHTAHEKCFIASSVNFPVLCAPEFVTI
jgi:organic hydroperoxide reductase OsmC/OhrA